MAQMRVSRSSATSDVISPRAPPRAEPTMSGSARASAKSSCSSRTSTRSLARWMTAPQSTTNLVIGTTLPNPCGLVSFLAMATREAACHCGQLRLEVTGDPFASPSVTALRANAGPEAHSGCRRGSHRIRWMSSVASATTRESPMRRTRRSMSSISARLRLAGLLHGTHRAGLDRRLCRRIRGPVLPAADRIGIRLPTASMGGFASDDRTPRP